MRRMVLVGLLALAFGLGVIVGNTLRPHSVAAATVSHIQSWGFIRDAENPSLLVLYDPATGEIWGYREHQLLGGAPIRLGKLTKVGAPIVK